MGDLDLSDASQDDGAGEREAHAVVGGDHPAEVGRAVGDGGGVIGCVDGHDPFGRGDGDNGESSGEDEEEAEHNGNGLFEGGDVLHAPEAGGEDIRTHADAHTADLEEGDELSGEGGGGELCVAHGAEHNGVHEVDADGDELLERDGNGDLRHADVEILGAEVVAEGRFHGSSLRYVKILHIIISHSGRGCNGFVWKSGQHTVNEQSIATIRRGDGDRADIDPLARGGGGGKLPAAGRAPHRQTGEGDGDRLPRTAPDAVLPETVKRLFGDGFSPF